jgi:hypothetical protein
MGGTRRTTTAGAANALFLHPRCHEWVERNRTAAYDMGFLVAQQDEPCLIAVRMWDGEWYLDDDGSKKNVIPDIEVAVDLNTIQRGLDSSVNGALADKS